MSNIIRGLIQIGKFNAINIAYLQQSFGLAMETCSVEEPVLTRGRWGSREGNEKKGLNHDFKGNGKGKDKGKLLRLNFLSF